MRIAYRSSTAIIAVITLLSPWCDGSIWAEERDGGIEFAKMIDAALLASASLDDTEQQLTLLKTTAHDTLTAATTNLFVADILRTAEQTKTTDPSKLVKEWRAALAEVRDLLRFEPLIEGPLPEGFPKPTPVGEIRLQQYPQYRPARTDMTLIEGRAFWTLFNHTNKRDIAMTAPVEMTYSSQGDDAPKKTAMAFMYRSTKQGQLGSEGKVEVVDVPAQTVISIGIRGDATKQRVADATLRLENWLQAHREEYESAGLLRVMGYNSPFVADEKRFTEVQIPVITNQRGKATAR